MLFLLALPVISGVALLWRYLQIYAPTNILIRKVRAAPPRWSTGLALMALASALLVAVRACTQVVERGAPGWINLIVLVLAWDAIKLFTLSLIVAVRRVTAVLHARESVPGGRAAS